MLKLEVVGSNPGNISHLLEFAVALTFQKLQVVKTLKEHCISLKQALILGKARQCYRLFQCFKNCIIVVFFTIGN